MKNPKVSIIIPLYVIEPRFFEDLKRFDKLDYRNFEILVVCDKKISIKHPRVKVLFTGKTRTGPAEKRDMAIKKAKGELCAFIDDDAYPHKDWLKNAILDFSDPRIAAVGGPGITPPEDGFWQQITGLVYQSYFCGGPTQHRFTKAKIRFVEDYPAYNLLIRKDTLEKVSGYGNYFYGGEDTFLCLKIIKAGWKIIYDPEVVVYHHRRAMFLPYLKQIANVGKHRGYFAKKFPETSRQLFYFFPSILTLGLLILIIGSFLNFKIFMLLLFGFLFFYAIGVLSIIKKTSFKLVLLASFGIIATHITYGTAFIQGLLTSDLKR